MVGESLLSGAELLIDSPMAQRGQRMLNALADCAPEGCQVTSSYQGKHKRLITYGVGLEQRLNARARHISRGGRVLMWDLGYWDRDESMRVSIDSIHPSEDQLTMAPQGARREFVLREDAVPDGPILLIGIGRKSDTMLGFRPLEWEQRKRAELKSRFPGRRIFWRPKGKYFVDLSGTKAAYGMPIESAMAGCSLVVCRHSNVAIDACIAGIPVECEDGAAHALYRHGSCPNRQERAEFLRRLSWWNWRPGEARETWNWIHRMTA